MLHFLGFYTKEGVVPLKRFLTFLGTGNYIDTPYIKNSFSYCSPYVQVAMIAYLKELGHKMDEVIIFVTSSSFDKHGKEMERQLKALFDGDIRFVHYEETTTEENLWDLFDLINQQLSAEDSYWFDITHGYRSVPLISLLSSQFATFLNGSCIEGIYYGQYEKEQQVGKIVDLSMLLQLGDWTGAIRSFQSTGNPAELIEIEKRERRAAVKQLTSEQRTILKAFQIGSEIEKVTQAIEMCRAHDLDKRIHRLKQIMYAYTLPETTIFRPYRYLFHSLKSTFSEMFEATTRVDIVDATIRWCLRYGLYQQAYTFLIESLYTETCHLYQLNPLDKEARNAVKNVFTKYGGKHKTYRIELRYEKIQRDLEERLSSKQKMLETTFNDLTKKRNNFLHADMNGDKIKETTLIESLRTLTPEIIALQRYLGTVIQHQPENEEEGMSC
ncbi:TM1812 family CRISPR-associated protein [Exiguobacterium indicum]|nr:TM1812 family CRISPR-associated protein [Exiguobacterium enclense]SDC80402.1 CRISPR-associated protein, TM1812 family [Exiguobacterium enclense]